MRSLAEAPLTRPGVTSGSFCLCSRDPRGRARASHTALPAQSGALILGRRCLATLEAEGQQGFPGRQCRGQGLGSEGPWFQILRLSHPGRVTLDTSLPVLHCAAPREEMSGPQQILGAIHTENPLQTLAPFRLNNMREQNQLYLRVHLLSFLNRRR